MRLRLFLTCWIVFSAHFATNVVREHYPAFTLIDHGHFQLDEYAGFHADIFQHTDGHHYIGNQITASVIAAFPLFVFDPVLDALQDYRLRQIAAGTLPEGGYDTDGPNSRIFYTRVKERGLDLRLGAAAFITSAFLMAPLCALFALLVFGALRRRGVPEVRAGWVTILFAFGTPIFYRSVALNHNVFVALAVFGSFLLLWPGMLAGRLSGPRRRFAAGFLAGLALALDYAGVIPLLCLFGYLLWIHRSEGGWRGSLRAAPAFILGSVPPVLFLLWSQWVIFGNAFLPGQVWMPRQNEFVEVGARGMTAPDLQLLWLNLVSLDWGLFTFAPVLLLALLPLRRSAAPRLLDRDARSFVFAFSALFLLFCSCNQYSRLQWNTGFRYLLPLVPLLFLVAADHLVRMRAKTLALVLVPLVFYTWVLTMVRYLAPVRGAESAIPGTWRRFLEEGFQLPWLSVLRRTSSLPWPVIEAAWLPYALLAVLGLVIWSVWAWPRRRKAAQSD